MMEKWKNGTMQGTCGFHHSSIPTFQYSSSSFSGGFFAELGKSGFDTSDVAAKSVKARGFFELSTGLLEAQIENLLAQIAAIRHEFGKRLFLNFFALILFHNN
jgi:hypothetical protein